jgi:hypothetical protein
VVDRGRKDGRLDRGGVEIRVSGINVIVLAGLYGGSVGGGRAEDLDIKSVNSKLRPRPVNHLCRHRQKAQSLASDHLTVVLLASLHALTERLNTSRLPCVTATTRHIARCVPRCSAKRLVPNSGERLIQHTKPRGQASTRARNGVVLWWNVGRRLAVVHTGTQKW